MPEPTTTRRFRLMTERVTELEVKHETNERFVAFKLEQVIDKLSEIPEAIGKIADRVTALETARAVQRAWIAGALAAGGVGGGFIGWAIGLALKGH